MDISTPVLIAFVAVVSVTANALLSILLWRARRSPPPQPTTEASDLLHDLTTKGMSLVTIQVQDPEGLLMWRRR